MTTRIGIGLSVLLACLALSLNGCGKDDKKKDDKKDDSKKDSAKKDDSKKDDSKKDSAKKDDSKKDDSKGGSGDLAAMNAMADKLVKLAESVCDCKDAACAEAKDKEMEALMEEGDKAFGGDDDKDPPQEIMDKIMPAMEKAGGCMEKLMGDE